MGVALAARRPPPRATIPAVDGRRCRCRQRRRRPGGSDGGGHHRQRGRGVGARRAGSGRHLIHRRRGAALAGDGRSRVGHVRGRLGGDRGERRRRGPRAQPRLARQRRPACRCCVTHSTARSNGASTRPEACSRCNGCSSTPRGTRISATNCWRRPVHRSAEVSPSGALLWPRDYIGWPKTRASLTLSPDGADVVVTGMRRHWTRRTTPDGGPPLAGDGCRRQRAPDVVADGARVYVTGQGVTGAGTPAIGLLHDRGRVRPGNGRAAVARGQEAGGWRQFRGTPDGARARWQPGRDWPGLARVPRLVHGGVRDEPASCGGKPCATAD